MNDELVLALIEKVREQTAAVQALRVAVERVLSERPSTFSETSFDALSGLVGSVYDILGSHPFQVKEVIVRAAWEGRDYARLRAHLERICRLDAASAGKRIGHAFLQASKASDLNGLRLERVDEKRGGARWRVVELDLDELAGSAGS